MKMRAFDSQLLRLKQALGMTDDQDVARVLGMTKAAFSARKTRGAFPEDKLKALASDRPELRLDVKYVLTGVSDELERRMAAVGTATRIAGRVEEGAARSEVQQAVFDALVGTLTPDEQQLVHYFRNSDERGRALMLATGATVAVPMDARVKRAARKKT